MPQMYAKEKLQQVTKVWKRSESKQIQVSHNTMAHFICQDKAVHIDHVFTQCGVGLYCIYNAIPCHNLYMAYWQLVKFIVADQSESIFEYTATHLKIHTMLCNNTSI